MSRPTDADFRPLPHWNWDRRPETLPLDSDECATAIYLANGRLDHAAELLKVEPRRLRKAIKRDVSLRWLLTQLEEAPARAPAAGQDGQVGVGR